MSNYCSEDAALLATDTIDCLQNLNWVKVNHFHQLFVSISVDSVDIELGMSEMCL